MKYQDAFALHLGLSVPVSLNPENMCLDLEHQNDQGSQKRH